MSDFEALLTGFPVYIATKEIQKRKHHKKRINKKWKKKYGCYELNTMPHGMVLFNEIDRTCFMTKKTYEDLFKHTSGKEKGK